MCAARLVKRNDSFINAQFSKPAFLRRYFISLAKRERSRDRVCGTESFKHVHLLCLPSYGYHGFVRILLAFETNSIYGGTSHEQSGLIL